MKNNIFKYGLGAILWIVFTFPALAGPMDPPGEDDPIDPAPIDSGIWLLIILAFFTGIYYLKFNKKIKSIQNRIQG